MKLGERLRELRRQRDQTLLQVAQSTDLSVSYLSDAERGKARPSIDTLERLAAHYHLSLADLVDNVDGWGEESLDALPAGLVALVNDGTIDAATARDLGRIELRGKRPQDEEEWRELYLHLKRIMLPYLRNQDPPETGR